MNFNEAQGIIQMSPDPLRAGGVWGRDYLWLAKVLSEVYAHIGCGMDSKILVSWQTQTLLHKCHHLIVGHS